MRYSPCLQEADTQREFFMFEQGLGEGSNTRTSFADIIVGRAPLQNSLSARNALPRILQMRHFWEVRDDVIYFSTLGSVGTRASSWANHLTHAGHEVLHSAKTVLRRSPFHATQGVVRMVAILKGRHVLCRGTVPEVQASFRKHPIAPLHPEVACLMREQLKPAHMEAMKLSHIVVAHEPVGALRQRFVLGANSLSVCGAHDPVDLGQQAPGVAFLVDEYAFALPLAA